MNKIEARIFAKQKILSILDRELKEEKILQNLYSVLQKSKKIISYSSDKFEVNLKNLELYPELEIYYPKIESIEERKLSFIKPENWKIGPYSILEPIGNKKIKPTEADYILVPGLGFNHKGYRLGRGAGYYDRALENINPQKLIGISFEEIFSIDFTSTPNDIRVSRVIFEKEILKFED